VRHGFILAATQCAPKTMTEFIPAIVPKGGRNAESSAGMGQLRLTPLGASACELTNAAHGGEKKARPIRSNALGCRDDATLLQPAQVLR
jgi:hypothetical protein